MNGTFDDTHTDSWNDGMHQGAFESKEHLQTLKRIMKKQR